MRVLLYIAAALLFGCTKAQVPPEVLNPIAADKPEKVSGLPRAREIEKEEARKPQVSRQTESSRAPSSALFPSGKVSPEWAEKRAKLIQAHQKRLNRFHIKRENTLGRPLPTVRVGE